MRRVLMVLVALEFFGAFSTMWGQGGFELTPMVGYRFGGNIELVNPVSNPTARKLQIESNPAYGVALNHGVHDNIQVEFQWSRQDTHINSRSRVTNTSSRLFGAYVDQYHANFLFHPAESGWHTLPFAVFGLGATTFSPRASLSSRTQFSFELGGGIKHFFAPHFGLRLEAKWTPSYLRSNEEWFCNGFGECYSVSDPIYAQQGEVISGIIFRF
ncbi:MAG TPA: outer membrane beta-barrel protein [Terriglobales bacterium]|nr:outer membrane beta-barrel protein [Terriglobales bacterium]